MASNDFASFCHFHPLRSGPAPWLCHLTAVDARRRNQYEALRLPVRRRRQEDAPDQTENGRRRADTERQREHGNQGETGLFAEHAQAQAHLLDHWWFPPLIPLDERHPGGLVPCSEQRRQAAEIQIST